MFGSRKTVQRSPFYNWVRATTLGWLLGFVLVVVLAMIWDTIGGGAQFMVGVGMGAGVGFLQSRAIGPWIEPTRRWLWASTLGMGLPFVLWDLGAAVGVERFFSVPLCVLTGALLTGFLQGRLLRLRYERAMWWVAACVVGWGLPAGAAALSNPGLSPILSLLPILAMFLGGVVLGIVTGRALLWIAQPPEGRAPASTGGEER